VWKDDTIRCLLVYSSPWQNVTIQNNLISLISFVDMQNFSCVLVVIYLPFSFYDHWTNIPRCWHNVTYCRIIKLWHWHGSSWNCEIPIVPISWLQSTYAWKTLDISSYLCQKNTSSHVTLYLVPIHNPLSVWSILTPFLSDYLEIWKYKLHHNDDDMFAFPMWHWQLCIL